ncbi:MAG: hypothetical protein ACLSA0_18730 [Eisenbergiella massiliensis]
MFSPPAGDPSLEIRENSCPHISDASSTGLAMVAELHKNCGALL